SLPIITNGQTASDMPASRNAVGEREDHWRMLVVDDGAGVTGGGRVLNDWKIKFEGPVFFADPGGNNFAVYVPTVEENNGNQNSISGTNVLGEGRGLPRRAAACRS